MHQNNKIVHSVWVGTDLSLLENLTIKLLQSHEHEVHLWSYGNLNNVPEGVIVRDATEILPISSIFRYAGIPLDCLPNGGIGSLSHWSDQFQLKLLHRFGGIYTQLDVAYLAPLNFDNDCIMPVWLDIENPENTSVAPYFMKCKAGSVFTEAAYKKTASLLHKNIDWSNVDWNASMRIIGNVLQYTVPNIQDCMLDLASVWDLGCSRNLLFFEDVEIPSNIKIIHWSNATAGQDKNNPVPGSTYWKLLKQFELIKE